MATVILGNEHDLEVYMSILKGALSATPYRVGTIGDGEVPTLSNDQLLDGLRSYAFRERELQNTEPVFGWCSANSVIETSFEDINDCILDRYVLFSLRQDRKRIPTKLFKALLQQRVKAWCEENGRQRCPSSTRGEIKELLEFEMVQKADTDVKAWDVLWNTEQGWVLFDSSAQGTNERFTKLFFETFGVVLRSVTPLDLPEDDLLRGRAMVTGGLDYRPGQPLVSQDTSSAPPMNISDQEDTPTLPHLAYEFLLWLWWKTEVQCTDIEVPGIEGKVDAWTEGRVVMCAPDADKATTTVTGENPCAAPECRRAMEHGKLPCELKVSLRRDDREFATVLRTPDLHPRSIRLPQVVSGADEEALYDRMFLFEELRDILSKLFTWFLSMRVQSDWIAGDGADIKAWLAKEESEQE